jgi:hypothetical protein
LPTFRPSRSLAWAKARLRPANTVRPSPASTAHAKEVAT